MGRTTKGRIFTRGKKNSYYLQYYVNGREFRTALKDNNGKNITTAREAEKAARVVLSPIIAGGETGKLEKVIEALSTVEQKAERIEAEAKNVKATITEGWELFFSCPKRPKSCRRYTIKEANGLLRKCTVVNYRRFYRLFASWINVNYPNVMLLSDVTSEAGQSLIDDMRMGGKSSGTVNQYLTFMKCFYDTIIKDGKVVCKNPFGDIEKVEYTYHSKKPLTVEQIVSLFNQADGDMKKLIALGYFTGFRLGDCCTLLWSEIDLIRGVIERIPRKTANRVKDKSQSTVKIGMPSYLAILLEETPPARRKGYVLPDIAAIYESGKDFNISKMITELFDKCGIEIRQPGTGATFYQDGKRKHYEHKRVRAVTVYGFHSLRYSYISHNAEIGTPQAVIQRNAGHSNPAMTEHYTKISDEAAVKFAARLQLAAGAIEAKAIEVKPTETERAELRDLADTLEIEKIRQILKTFKGI